MSGIFSGVYGPRQRTQRGGMDGSQARKVDSLVGSELFIILKEVVWMPS